MTGDCSTSFSLVLLALFGEGADFNIKLYTNKCFIFPTKKIGWSVLLRRNYNSGIFVFVKVTA